MLLTVLALVGAANAPAPTLAVASKPSHQPIVEGVRWPDVSLPVVVDLSGISADWQVLARAALATWNGAGAQFWYVEPDDASTGANAVRLEEIEQIMLCGAEFQPAACTFPFIYQFAPQHMSSVRIQLNRPLLRGERPRRPPVVVDVAALLTHELGHAAGLGEATNRSAAMYTAALWTVLSEDDVRELRTLYGTADGPRPQRAPTLWQPADGSAAPLNLTLRWEPVPAAFGYYVQVETAAVYDSRGGFVDVGFGEYVADVATEGPEHRLARPLVDGTQYYWRVKARTPGGNSPWSTPAHFVASTAASP